MAEPSAVRGREATSPTIIRHAPTLAGKYPLDGSMLNLIDREAVDPTYIREVESWLATLSEARQSRTYRPPDFFRPYHLATFALMLRAGGYDEVAFPEKFETYAIRMGVYDAAGIPPPRTVRKTDSKGRFQPVTPLTDPTTVTNVADSLSRICSPQAATRETVDSLEIAISELLENCYAHGRKQVGGFHGLAAAQAWFYGHLAQIAVADAGIGIRARLMDNPDLHELLASENACELATRYGVTADAIKPWWIWPDTGERFAHLEWWQADCSF